MEKTELLEKMEGRVTKANQVLLAEMAVMVPKVLKEKLVYQALLDHLVFPDNQGQLVLQDREFQE